MSVTTRRLTTGRSEAVIRCNVGEHFGDLALYYTQDNGKQAILSAALLPSEVQLKLGTYTGWVKAKPFRGVATFSEQGHEMESYYLDFKMEVRSVIGRVPFTLSNFLKLRKFRTVTVRIDS